MREIVVAPADPERRDGLLELFGDNGAYSNCWCTWWMLPSRVWDLTPVDERRRMLLDLVEEDDPAPGLLAIRESRVVGWCAVGPRERYARMMSDKARTFKRIDDEPTWVVNCFYIDRGARGSGVATALLNGAVDHARNNGARIIEAYPIDMDVRDPGPAGLYVGTLGMFESAGFTEVARFGTRPLVRLAL